MAIASGLPMKPGEVKTYPTEIKKKQRFVPQPKQPRDRDDWLLRNGSQEQARASQIAHAIRQGEKPEDA